MLNRPVVVLVLTAFAVFFGFQLLLSVVPLYTERAGGGSSGAGLATGVFMLSTVLTQIQMPRLLRWLGYGWTLAAGLLFLGVPAFFYIPTESVEAILAVTLLRGVGFGIVTVVFVALIVKLVPPGRTGLRRWGCSASPSQCRTSSATLWGCGSWTSMDPAWSS